MTGESNDQNGEALSQQVISQRLYQIVTGGAGGGCKVVDAVKQLYAEDPRAKTYLKESLGTTALSLLQSHPALQVVDGIVSLSPPGDLNSSPSHPPPTTTNTTGTSPPAASAGQRGGAAQRMYTIEEVRRHAHMKDAWIVVEGEVYDITPFVATHWGWSSAGKNSTIIAIMSALGGDCSADFRDVHRGLADWKKILVQLKSFKIGRLAEGETDGQHPTGQVTYKTWGELVEMGSMPANAVQEAVQRNQGYSEYLKNR